MNFIRLLFRIYIFIILHVDCYVVCLISYKLPNKFPILLVR